MNELDRCERSAGDVCVCGHMCVTAKWICVFVVGVTRVGLGFVIV